MIHLHIVLEIGSTPAGDRRVHTCPFVGAHQIEPKALDARMLFCVRRHTAVEVGPDQEHLETGDTN